MKLLLIESDHIDTTWLRRYMARYAADITIIGVSSLTEAETMLRGQAADADVILLDTNVEDVLEPGAVHDLLHSAPPIPIVLIVTGKTSQYACRRIPDTRAFLLRTDVSDETFLHHLTTLVRDMKAELGEKAAPPGEAHG